MTDYKHLCKLLAEDLSFWIESDLSPSQLPYELNESYKLVQKAFKALREEPGAGSQ